MRRLTGRLARWVLTGLGVGVLIYLVWRMGWRTTLENVVAFGAWFAVILFLQMIWVVLQAVAWAVIQNSLSPRAPLAYFVRIRVIGDTMNTVLPAANVGGDAMRAFLVRSRIPLKEGVAGVLVDKTVESVAGVLFMASGLLLSMAFFPVPQTLAVPAVVSLLVLLTALALLVYFQLRGFYQPAIALVGWIPAARRFLQAKQAVLLVLDENIRRLYARRGSAIPLATALHTAARLLGAVEVVIVLWVLGAPVGFLGAWFISAAITVANTMFFVIPGHWGVQEGMSVLVLTTLGISGPVGLSLAIIRRIRRIVFLGFGLLVYHLEKDDG